MDRLLDSESGYTLIEILLIVVIIGILIAIAIPQFSAYRKRGHEAQVRSDLRNAATAEDAYFAQFFTFKGGTLSSGIPTGFSKSNDVSLSATVGTNSFLLSASHSNCGSTTWTFSSTTGETLGPTGGCP